MEKNEVDNSPNDEFQTLEQQPNLVGRGSLNTRAFGFQQGVSDQCYPLRSTSKQKTQM
ncbi:UNVERIFIED_CONTAM: hypothetical protein Slati_1880900 [Sesamum latifolium]|uniref:Uncharacterized protein n=1 Tax=Sesamum latifolium TaxID=2727402 RepID=A0AAW2X1V1_9LAMI